MRKVEKGRRRLPSGGDSDWLGQNQKQLVGHVSVILVERWNEKVLPNRLD